MTFIIQKVMQYVDVFDLLKRYDLYHGMRKDTTILCPFHSENTPSARLYRDGKLYCFGACQKMYDPIKFVMSYEDLSYRDAVKWLGEHFNFEVDDSFFKKEFSEEEIDRWEKKILEYRYLLSFENYLKLWELYDAQTLTEADFKSIIKTIM